MLCVCDELAAHQSVPHIAMYSGSHPYMLVNL